ncbi:MAG: PqqD family protein [Prevotellaceae bacterium]|nr:PqqD family protein [Candidatus Minthosoma caballi]
MRVRKGFELRTICGENIIISHGIENIDFSKVITLNESAAAIWNKLAGQEFNESDMVKVLLDEYEVDEVTAQSDVVNLVASWIDAGLIEN